MNYKKGIALIKKFKSDFESTGLKSPGLLGFIGELYVLQKLDELGYNPHHKGGQGGYDIYIEKIDKRVEVKTSILKNEGEYDDKSIKFWGWAVERRGQKRSKKFDYFVCVALDDHYSNPKFYIFTYKEAFSVKNVRVPRYTNIKKKIHIFKDILTFRKACLRDPKMVTPFERTINQNQTLFRNQWKKIKLELP